MQSQGKTWNGVSTVLALAAKAYRIGDGNASPPEWKREARINCIQIETLLDPAKPDFVSITRCQEVARDCFYRDYRFLLAVMT